MTFVDDVDGESTRMFSEAMVRVEYHESCARKDMRVFGQLLESKDGTSPKKMKNAHDMMLENQDHSSQFAYIDRMIKSASITNLTMKADARFIGPLARRMDLPESFPVTVRQYPIINSDQGRSLRATKVWIQNGIRPMSPFIQNEDL